MRSVRHHLYRFLGRIVGLAVGALAGPAGALFGLLVGWMVDQYRSSGVSALRVERFLADPAAESNLDRRVVYATAAIAVELLTADSWPGQETISFLFSERWPRGRTRRIRPAVIRRIRPAGEDPVFRRRTFDMCLLERHRLDIPRILSALPDALAQGEGPYLADLLIRMLAVRGRGIGPAERAIIASLAEALHIERSEIARYEAVHGTLSRRECDILGVEPTADRTTIKRSYRRLVAQLHPDTGSQLDGEQREIMEGAFLRIHEAYETLLRQLDERDPTPTP